tara:strand:- start:3198 stop:3506 length:309 start_codon:yes stop_codon:yes gene_type:complete
MVTFKYKGTRTKFVRTDGGRVIAFGSGSVHELDENDKRSKELVKKMLAFPEDFEVQRDVGAKKVGGGVRTRGKASRAKKEEVKPKAKPKKGKGLRRPKRKTK